MRPLAASLSGSRLAVRTADAIEVFDIGSGAPIARFPVRQAVVLADLEDDVLVTVVEKTVTLRRLSDGRMATFRAAGPAQAQLEPAGLFLAGGRLLTFVPMAAVVRRLGN